MFQLQSVRISTNLQKLEQPWTRLSKKFLEILIMSVSFRLSSVPFGVTSAVDRKRVYHNAWRRFVCKVPVNSKDESPKIFSDSQIYIPNRPSGSFNATTHAFSRAYTSFHYKHSKTGQGVLNIENSLNNFRVKCLSDFMLRRRSSSKKP